MPELPEVETIKNELKPYADGHTVKKIDILWPPTLRGSTEKELNEKVAGHRITELTRRGKYLIFHFDNGKILLVHHKLTGSFHAEANLKEPPKNTRAIIHLDDCMDLYFVDPRRFGRFELADPDTETLKKLGPEPLSRQFTEKRLAEILAKRKSPIKPVLLNQELIAGIGNLYADEILFASRIHPERPANSLTPAEVKKLYTEIRRALRNGIKRKGASIATYYRPGGEKGSAHLAFRVARKAGEPCPQGCKGKISYKFFRGRGTYFCPSCQH